jgi:hypothetical protein
MRLSCQWIAKEQNRVHLAFRGTATNDQIASMWAVCHAFDMQAKCFVEHLACVTCRNERLLAKKGNSSPDKFEHLLLQSIVGNQGDHEAFLL